jgi:hypothetical protein
LTYRERITPKQFEKLPKYVQQELLSLRREHVRLERDLAEARGARSKTRVFVDDYLGGPIEYLPEEDGIAFDLSQKADGDRSRKLRAMVKIGFAGELYLELLGGSVLSLEPQSSNIVRVSIKDF